MLSKKASHKAVTKTAVRESACDGNPAGLGGSTTHSKTLSEDAGVHQLTQQGNGEQKYSCQSAEEDGVQCHLGVTRLPKSLT